MFLLCAIFSLVAASDPTCEHGIRHDTVCCASSCGSCGGKNCSSLPGGSVSCCGGKIEAAGLSCSTHDAPCVIGPAPPPSPSSPTPAPAPSSVKITVAGKVATVAPEYVSFNLDTSEMHGSVDLLNPALMTLAGALAPAHLRVGGTQGDYDIYAFGAYEKFDCVHPPAPMTSYRCKTITESGWRAMLNFATQAKVNLIYGLNDMFMRPTKTSPEKKLCTSAGCPARNQVDYIEDYMDIAIKAFLAYKHTSSFLVLMIISCSAFLLFTNFYRDYNQHNHYRYHTTRML